MKLRSNTILITGGGSGIGYELTKKITALGKTILINGRDSAKKAGGHSFTESFSVQLKNTKVKVFDLAPPATQTELLGGFNSEDMKGVSIMKVEDMVKVAIEGMQTDRFEIRPGQANQLKMMSRVAPGFILKQMSRSVDRMLRTQN